jgi:ferredoxin/flavodoxin
MEPEIYYFSGTGNSLYIAKVLAGKLNGRITPIASLAEQEAVTPVSDVIGIVFPVYYMDLPLMVKSFAEKLTGIGGKYVFAVCNFGGGAGVSLKNLRRILQERGGELSAGYGVHMPQNAFLKPWEKRDKIYAACARKAEFIVRKTAGRKKGLFYSNVPLEMLMRPFCYALKPVFKKGIQKYSGAPDSLGVDEIIRMADKSFSASEKCVGCGACARVCPAANIRMEGETPVWLNRCENCLACYNWCPNKAIEGGPSKKGYYYVHPEIKASEMKFRV